MGSVDNEFAVSSMDVDDDSFESELYAVVLKVQGWDTARKVPMTYVFIGLQVVTSNSFHLCRLTVDS